MNREDITRMAQEAGFVGMDGDHGALRRFAALVASAESERIKQANAPEIERVNAYIKKLEVLAQTDYKSTSDYQFMENAQGELERIKLVQTGVGIEQRAEEAYEAAKQRSWIGVSDEMAQLEQSTECGEPLPWTNKMSIYVPNQPLYTAPQRTWIEIDGDDWIKALEMADFDKVAAFEFFEDKLKELNT